MLIQQKVDLSSKPRDLTNLYDPKCRSKDRDLTSNHGDLDYIPWTLLAYQAIFTYG